MTQAFSEATVSSHFKGVVWPRRPAVVNGSDNKVQYRYVIVGVLTTDRPIDFFEGKQSILLDGYAFGLPDALGTIRQRPPRANTGNTASEVLANLKGL